MKFLVDAHLPRRLVWQFKQAGFDAKHTLDLPLGNRTQDLEIDELSIQEQRVVVTKDSDFVDSIIEWGIFNSYLYNRVQEYLEQYKVKTLL